MQHWFWWFIFIMFVSCEMQACPSPAGGACDPRKPNCPESYSCGLAEVCTRACEQTTDCWVKVESGCRSNYFPGQRLPDGGVYQDTTEDGFCPETKVMECIEARCQRAECADGGCDYDLYGPSPFKGNRDQGPEE